MESSITLKKDEPVFVSSRYPQYSTVIDPGGAVAVAGRIVTNKPVYVDFHPHPLLGGVFVASKRAAAKLKMSQEDLVEALRQRDSIDDEFVEVRDEAHLDALMDLRAKIQVDNVDRVVVKRDAKAAPPPLPRVKEPGSKKAPAPAPAAGPVKAPATAGAK